MSPWWIWKGRRLSAGQHRSLARLSASLTPPGFVCYLPRRCGSVPWSCLGFLPFPDSHKTSLESSLFVHDRHKLTELPPNVPISFHGEKVDIG